MSFDPDKYLAKKSQPEAKAPEPKKASGSFDPDAYLASKEEGMSLKDLGMKGLDLGIRVMDAPGGFIRTGLANVAGLVSGKGTLVTEQDLKGVAAGQAPPSSEYLERLGVPEGPSVNLMPEMTLPYIGKVGKGSTSARDAAGFAADIVTSPAGMLKKALGLKSAGVLSKGSESAGKSMFKSGLKKVDEKLIEKGKAPVSELLLESGSKGGSMKKLSKEAEEVGNKILKERDQLYEQAGKAGAFVDMSDVVKNAEKEIAKIRANPGTRELADKLTKYLDRYRSEGFVGLKDASDWKTALYEALPESAYGPLGKIKGPAKNFEKVLANDFKTAIEASAERALPGAGKGISEANKKLGTVLSSKKSFANEIKKANTPNFVTTMDALGPGSLGLLTGSMTDPVTGALVGAAGLGLKKAADVSKTTGFRTRAGRGLIDLGKTGLLDEAAKRAVINLKRKDERR